MNDTNRNEIQEKTERGRAFDAGNYAAAYEGETCTVPTGYRPHQRGGYLLGFFSSYEPSEVPEEWRTELELLRTEEKLEALALDLLDRAASNRPSSPYVYPSSLVVAWRGNGPGVARTPEDLALAKKALDRVALPITASMGNTDSTRYVRKS